MIEAANFQKAGRLMRAAALCLLTSASAHAQPSELESCSLQDGGRATVARVLDGETVQLDDRREVRLIGALAPRARDTDAEPGSWPAEQGAVAALSSLTIGKRVRLAYGGRRADRYGRALAHLFVDGDGGEIWVQGFMLEHGHARAYGLSESFTCGRELLAHEAEARRRRAGLWAIHAYRPLAAARPGPLMRARGRYALVHGRVRKAATTKSAIYLNFGLDWRSDFTVRVPVKATGLGKDLATFAGGLEGKRILVRGWIERRNGPMIDVLDASQIEILERGPEARTRDRVPDASAEDSASRRPEKERPPASIEKRTGDLDL